MSEHEHKISLTVLASVNDRDNEVIFDVDIPPTYYTEREVAKILKLNLRQLRGERDRGRIEFFRIVGRQIRYTPEQIRAYVTDHPRNQTETDDE